MVIIEVVKELVCIQDASIENHHEDSYASLIQHIIIMFAIPAGSVFSIEGSPQSIPPFIHSNYFDLRDIHIGSSCHCIHKRNIVGKIVELGEGHILNANDEIDFFLVHTRVARQTDAV